MIETTNSEKMSKESENIKIHGDIINSIKV